MAGNSCHGFLFILVHLIPYHSGSLVISTLRGYFLAATTSQFISITVQFIEQTGLTNKCVSFQLPEGVLVGIF